MATATKRGPAYRTPWGVARGTVTMVGTEGIYFASTASHGGYYVPDALVGKIDPRGRADAKRWSESENWYEEDCCWCWVALAFPELFPTDAAPTARAILTARGFKV
jgi:hypothetical protein